MSRSRALDPERLLYDARWAVKHDLPPRDLIPMLEKLVASAPAGSVGSLFGMRHLARAVVGERPWQAAVLARSVLAHGDDELAFAVLGLAHSLLGHYRTALRAYLRAAALAPTCPIVSHNLGHLLDVGLDRPEEALGYLAKAHNSEPNDAEIAASYAHALVRTGQRAQAEQLLRVALGDRKDEVGALLDAWSRETTVPARTALSG
jgi:tetratricopeptide (TPR) repeat protein